MDVAVSIDADGFTGWSTAVDVNPTGKPHDPPIFYVISDDGALGLYGTADAIIELAASLAQAMYSTKLTELGDMDNGRDERAGDSPGQDNGHSCNGSGNAEV